MSRQSWPFYAVAVVVGVVVLVVLFRPFAGPGSASTGRAPGPSGAGPVTSPTAEACETALMQGYLSIEDDAFVLQASNGETQAIVWLSGYSVRGDGDALVLVDSNGSIKARPGDYLQVGGGVGTDGAFHGCGDIAVVPLSDVELPASGTVIDGFKIGVREACSAPVGSIDPSFAGSSCAGQPALALAALDARDPGHAAVISTAMYTDGTQPEPVDVTGNAPTPTPPPTTHPGPLVTVFVFTLADGSVRATGVACPDARPCVGVGSYPH